MRIQVTDIAGLSRAVDGTLGWTVMEAVRDGGLPMKAECGGCVSCATCHVRVDSTWVGRLPAASDDEQAMLDAMPVRYPNSRLSCQIVLTTDLEGLEVALTPDCTE